MSTDVLGRIVEVVSGQSLDEFFAERIFAPLGMTDTGLLGLRRRPRAHDRALRPRPARRPPRSPIPGSTRSRPSAPKLLAGGHGLASTAADYHRFTQMLLRRGELDGVRLLAPRTVDLMTANHLPGNATLTEFGRPLLDLVVNEGYGFGLGLSPLVDPIAAKTLSAAGEYRWEGAAGTAFWVDPAADMTVLFFTQVLFGSDDVWVGMRPLVYQALVGGSRRPPATRAARGRDEAEKSPWSRICSAAATSAPTATQVRAPPTLMRCPPASTISLIDRPRCASTLTGLDTASQTARISSPLRSPGA